MDVKKHQSFVCIIFVLALLVRLIGIDFGLPDGSFYPNEHELIGRAVRLGTGDLNPHWFINPSLYLYWNCGLFGLYFVIGYLLQIFHSVDEFATAYFVDPSAFYLIGRSSTAFLGALTLVAVYSVGKKLYGSLEGLVASALLAFAPGHVLHSKYASVDVPMTCLTIVAFVFVVRIYRIGDRKAYLLAGIFTGLATATKYTAGALILSIAVAHLLRLSKAGMPWTRKLFSPRLLASLSLALASFLVACPFAILDFGTFIGDIMRQATYSSTGGRPGWVSASSHTWLYHLSVNLPQVVGIMVLLAALGFLLKTIWLRDHWEDTALLLSFPLPFFLIIGSSKLPFLRFILPLSPFIALLAAGFIVWIVSVANIRRDKCGLAIALLTSLIVFPTAVQTLQLDYLLTHKDTRELAKEWIETNIPTGTAIAVENYGPGLLDSVPSLLRKYKGRKRKFDQDIYAKRFELLLEYRKRVPTKVNSYDLYSFSVSEAADLAPFLRENRIEYVILSSGTYARYFTKGTLVHFPQTAKQYQELYDTIDGSLELVKEFIPDSRSIPGPIIKIYRVPDSLRLSSQAEVSRGNFDPFPRLDEPIYFVGHARTSLW